MSHARFARDRTELRGLRVICMYVCIYIYTYLCMYLHRYICLGACAACAFIEVDCSFIVNVSRQLSQLARGLLFLHIPLLFVLFTFPFYSITSGRKSWERGDNGLEMEMEMVLQIDEGVAQWAHWAAGVFQPFAAKSKHRQQLALDICMCVYAYTHTRRQTQTNTHTDRHT